MHSMKILNSQFKLLSSLEKIFFDIPENMPETSNGSMFKNEIYSFQLATKITYDGNERAYLRYEIESELKDFISMYQIGYVPSMLPANPERRCSDYITLEPGLFPDPMHKLRGELVRIASKRAVSLWFVIEPKEKIAGTFPITIKVYDEADSLLSEKTFTIEIIDVLLPKQRLKNTCWFYGDCLAALHNTEIGSSEYDEIVRKYLEVYVKFGHNMILTPIFTPPLDTKIGGERPTNQLVDVTFENGKYSFNFDKLDMWIDMCHEFGIEYFEISHLFTQWGAYFTPKIMATADGEYKRIFGWDVEATSDEYVAFLDTFLPKLREYLTEKGVYESCYFHVSDEPNDKHEEQYKKTRFLVAKHIDENKMMDAISDYLFYQKGLIKKPVVATDFMEPFLENNVPNLWAYYCCGEGVDVSNRFMAMPSYRNRILGYELYKYNIEGFLQWGYNFWFSYLSTRVIDPYKETEAEDVLPSGDAYVVYPLDKEGEVVTSLRLYVFGESIQDMRALELLESLTSREEVLKLLDDVVGFTKFPRNAEYILNLRETVNNKIKDAINSKGL
ncbi:MAG: DUF4091 domain-containing protein [Clostridia bacterium]|nr:DUF4091 domain-containing protein [Clostridia bacterium]